MATSPDPENLPRPPTDNIVSCAVVTLLFTLSFLVVSLVALVYLRNRVPWAHHLSIWAQLTGAVVWTVTWVLVYPRGHVGVGRIVARTALKLSAAVNEVYRIPDMTAWGRWTRSEILMFGVMWPLSLPWVVFLGLAVLMGKIYQRIVIEIEED